MHFSIDRNAMFDTEYYVRYDTRVELDAPEGWDSPSTCLLDKSERI